MTISPLLVRVLLTACLVIGSVEARAYKYIGVAGESCGTWTAARRDRTAFGLQEWIFGYLSGFGDGSESQDRSNGMDPLNGMDPQGVLAWVDNYCRDHPLDKILDAGAAFIRAHPR